jgi:hypothetical protein
MTTSARIVRPYASVEDFLDGDAWTVDKASMLLIGAEPVDPGTDLAFEIVLESGEVVVSGAGRAVEVENGNDYRPGGLRIKFRQLGADSKAMLKRALETRRAQARAAALEAEAQAAPAPVEPPPPIEAPPVVLRTVPKLASEKSGVHARATRVVPPPPNRDQLLDRLRERARRVGARGIDSARRTAGE